MLTAKILSAARYAQRLLFLGAILSVSLPCRADTVKIGGTGGALGTMKVLGEAFNKRNPDASIVIVPRLGSRGGRKALMAGAIDIAVTGKAGTKAEKLEGAVAYLCGRTPFVFATPKTNRASTLTTQQLVDIWNGKMITWPDGGRLRLILRPATDADTELLMSISPAMEQAVKNALAREGMRIGVTDGDSADAIESTPGALGTSTLALILSEKRALKPLAINGVMPSVKSITDGSYPYFKSFYMLTRPAPSETARQFVAFVNSKAGREILTQLGYSVVELKSNP